MVVVLAAERDAARDLDVCMHNIGKYVRGGGDEEPARW